MDRAKSVFQLHGVSLAGMGHKVRLIAPQYVRPFVKWEKKDAAEAEASVRAARQPEMRYVEPKSIEQQSPAVLFRWRERLVRQRTELVNALRTALFEFGFTVPQGPVSLKRAKKLLDVSRVDLSECSARGSFETSYAQKLVIALVRGRLVVA